MFKNIMTFARRSMRLGNAMKTSVAKTSVLGGIALALSLLSVIVSIASYSTSTWLKRYDIERDRTSILLVNSPSSFDSFIYQRHDNNLYIHSTCESQYDFIKIEGMLSDKKADVAIVFSDDCETLIKSDGQIEVMTYINTDNLNSYVKNSLAETILDEYSVYLQSTLDITHITYNTSVVKDYPVDKAFSLHFKYFALTGLIPLIIIVVILYTSMTGGTNIIAGEKERGTFAAIILTPVSRTSIVVGYTIGLSMLSIIPCVILLVLTGLFKGTLVGLLIATLMVISLAFLISSIVILISTASNSTITAQTAFVPVFLIFLGIATDYMQDVGNIASYLYFIPGYGHFMTIGDALISSEDSGILSIGYSMICLAITSIISIILLIIASNLLLNEKYVTTSEGLTRKQLARKERKHSWSFGFFIEQSAFPLVILSIVQTLALIPFFIVLSRDVKHVDFFRELQSITSIDSAMEKMGELMSFLLSNPVFLLSMTVGYIILIAIYLIRIRLFEGNHKPWEGLGFVNKRIVKHYAMGLGLGLIMLSTVFFTLRLLNIIDDVKFGLNTANIISFLAGIPMWIVQGASEEVMFRGFMIPRVSKKSNIFISIIFSSFLFAVLHGTNVGFTALAGINLFLIAVLFALIYLYNNSLWMNCALHSAWNFCQGSLYGLEVSGNNASASILKSSFVHNAPDLLTGGNFGPEGGLIVTIITVIGIVIISIIIKRRGSLGTSITKINETNHLS